MLPARDGAPLGEMRRSAQAPNCSYFVNWRKTSDARRLECRGDDGGTYVVTLDYTCPAADVGSTLELRVGE
ncbi:hypothetical protein EMGBS10_14980, partial [Opitutia bacterium]